jgi:integrase
MDHWRTPVEGGHVETNIRVEATIWETPGGRYQVRYRDASARQRARSFERLADARSFKAQARLLRPRYGQLDPAASRITFEEWAESYLEQKVSLRQRTRDRYEAELRAHLLPCFGDRPLFAIGRGDVQAFVVSVVERGLAPNTIRGLYHLLAAIMSLAEEDGLIQATPCRRISLPPVIIDDRRYLDAEEVECLASAIDPRYEALIYTAAYLGLRWHEIAGLSRRYVRLEQGRPATLRVISTVERSGGRCRVVDLGKTKAARRALAMPEFLRDILVAHLERYPDGEWVFPAPKGGFLRYDNFRTRVWTPAVERARLAPLTFHSLRHTAAAFMIDDRADPLQLKRRMGHEDIRPSLDTYGHLFEQREDALVNALDRRHRAAQTPLTPLGRGDFLVTSTRRPTAPLDRKSGDVLVMEPPDPALSLGCERASEQRL